MSADISTREGLFAVMTQIAAEREAAKPLVAELLKREEPPWDEDIPEEWKTAGFVEELTKGASASVEQALPRAILLLQFSIAISTSVPDKAYPRLVDRFLLSKIWNILMYCYRMNASYPEGMATASAADRATSQEASLIHDAAVTKFVRASNLVFMRKLDEADALLDECEREFIDFEDTRRVARCKIARATSALFRGDYQRSYTDLKATLDVVRSDDDLHTLGVVYTNLSTACLRLGYLDEAIDASKEAMRIYTEAGMRSEIIRAECGLGSAALAKGEYTTAIAILERARGSFLADELIETAGLIGLEIVEALIATNRSPEAQLLTEQVLNEFRYANLSDKAVTALAYLREFLRSSDQARATVKHVRSYVEVLKKEPAEVFLPLPDDTTRS